MSRRVHKIATHGMVEVGSDFMHTWHTCQQWNLPFKMISSLLTLQNLNFLDKNTPHPHEKGIALVLDGKCIISHHSKWQFPAVLGCDFMNKHYLNFFHNKCYRPRVVR